MGNQNCLLRLDDHYTLFPLGVSWPSAFLFLLPMEKDRAATYLLSVDTLVIGLYCHVLLACDLEAATLNLLDF